MHIYTKNNEDNITEAIRGLDIFTKNWCMNCEETEKQHELIFRCYECCFKSDGDGCAIKKFAYKHDSSYPMRKFGAMGQL